MIKTPKFLSASTVCALLSFSLLSLSDSTSQPVLAGTFTLVDDNSTADFDTALDRNQVNWFVDGTNQLFAQTFFYRIGNGPEIPVPSLTIDAEGTSDVNFDGDDETLFIRYDGGTFDIEITYSLDGGLPGSGASDLAEQISINSKTEIDLDFHFFQYVDFDLNGTAGGDTGVFTNANTVRQSEAGARVTETVVTSVPSHRELATVPTIFGKLTDGVATTLSDTPPPGSGIGPSNLEWAFQWDFNLGSNSTFQISKDKNLKAIPEPTSYALALVGLCLAGRRRR